MNGIYKAVKHFVKKETVLSIAAVLAVLSMLVVPPGPAYADYIDTRVLALLFCLMLVVAGWEKAGVFSSLGRRLEGRMKTARGLTVVLVLLCFSTSMVITNDVALITFVPFTIVVLGTGRDVIFTVVMETIAANLGSMLTPIGNPQNLYLFSLSKMTAGEFLETMLPLSVISLLVLLLLTTSHRYKEPLMERQALSGGESMKFIKEPCFYLVTVLFLICLGNVFHLISYPVVFLIVSAVILLTDRTLFARVDYSLLLTFVCFFIFIGNIGSISWVRDGLSDLIAGRELFLGVAMSQIISNVPAAMLLSKFTLDYRNLLWGVNIGGLGTMIASMASLISYRCYVHTEQPQKGVYVKIFTGYNILFLFILCVVAWIL